MRLLQPTTINALTNLLETLLDILQKGLPELLREIFFVDAQIDAGLLPQEMQKQVPTIGDFDVLVEKPLLSQEAFDVASSVRNWVLGLVAPFAEDLVV